ncbi:MAG: phospholipase D family protein [Gammaproteobacteria bacterium]|jgi:putative cardiolipin synthase
MNSGPLALLFSAALLLASCATTIPENYPRSVSTSSADPAGTELGRFFQPDISAHPGHSGVLLVPGGAWGFRARVGLSNQAEKTIDAQYYIWEDDATGRILSERILRAADRGVRVRMLVDHVTLGNKDFSLARIDRHPNVEIRLFNPFTNRRFRGLEMLFSLERLNHRMHNKAFIVDNAIAIVGGRNIGDNYFGIDTVENFRDLDLALVGPVVQEVSSSFDEYWNSELAVPVSVVIKEPSSAEELQARQADLYRWVAELDGFPYPIDTTSDAVIARLEDLRSDIIWAPAKVLFDEPDKLQSDSEDVMDHLIALGQHKESELLVESAYVIPGPENVERVRLNSERGIRQRLLTNSLATNDVAAAHAGYAKYRRDLIRNGVEVYELRPDARSVKKNWSLLAGRSKASLHTKAGVVDRRLVLIGSFNIDPRSTSLNTEIVIVVDSRELAAQVIEFMDDGARPENSYRVMLETDSETGAERLVWITKTDGEESRYYSEPEASLWRRFSTWLIGLLPIEKHL